MDLKNGYKVIYEKAKEGKRTFFASKSNSYPNAEDTELVSFTDADYAGRFLYEYKGKFYVTEAGKLPAYDENGVPTDSLLSDKFNEVFIKKDTEEVEETSVEETETEEVSEPDSTSENLDENLDEENTAD